MKKYEQIVIKMEKKIETGEYTLNQKLPTITELMKEFKTSQITIRKALEVLARKGSIYQVQGSGSYVRKKVRNGLLNIGTLNGTSMDLRKFNVTSKILKFEIIKADDKLVDKLKCEANKELYHIHRLRYIAGVPLCIESTYYVKETVVYLNKEIVQNSIFQFLEDEIKLEFGFSDKLIYAEKLDSHNANLLHLHENDPTIIFEETVYLANGQAFNYSMSYYNFEQARFFVQSEKQ